MKIILVDDHVGWLEKVGTLLQEAGYQVTACNSVEAALERYRAERPDLIITDLEMWPQPGGDGDRLITAVRAREDGDAHRTPIHMLSGAFRAQREWQQYGADGFTDKNPFLFSGRPLDLLLEIPARYVNLSGTT